MLYHSFSERLEAVLKETEAKTMKQMMCDKNFLLFQ